MYLDTNVSALFAENSLNTTMGQLDTTENQIATGNALADPATNPSESAIVALSQGHLGALTQASQNTAQGIDLLNTANGAVQNDVQIVQQMQSLAVQASNGTNTAQDRADLQSQVSALLNQIDHNSQVSYNGLQLLGSNEPSGSAGRSAKSSASQGTTWTALPWANSTDENAARGNDGTVSNLVAPDLPMSTATGGPAQYGIIGYTNLSYGPSTITIAAYASPAETAIADGDSPNGLVITLTQNEPAVPTSGTIAFDTSDSTASGFTIAATEDRGGHSTAYTGPPIAVQFTYDFGYGLFNGSDGLNYGDLGGAVFAGSGPAVTQSTGSTGTTGTLEPGSLTGLDLQIGGQNRAADQSPINLPAVTVQSLGLASVSFATKADAQDAITTIQGALTQLTTIQGGIGSHLDQLQDQASNLDTSIMQGQASQGSLADTNLATATAQAARQQILLRTGLQALTDANQSPDAILSLLRAV